MVKTVNYRKNWKTSFHPMKSRADVFQFVTPSLNFKYPHYPFLMRVFVCFKWLFLTGLSSRLISKMCSSGVSSSSSISQPSVARGRLNDDSDQTCRAGPYPGDYSTVNSEEPFYKRPSPPCSSVGERGPWRFGR